MTAVQDFALGLDIGGTKISAGLVDPDGRTSHVAGVPTPARSGATAILDAVEGLARDITRVAGIKPRAIGLGSAGTFDSVGLVTYATDHLAGWAGTPVAEELERRLGMPVVVVNDVHAAALGELWTGSARGEERMLFVAVGTGIGGAIITGGRVVRGANGMAGSVGHVRVHADRERTCSCGGADHVEAFASGPGIELSYRELNGSVLGLADIGGRAREGERDAVRTIRSSAELLGESLASAVTLSDPGTVVLGGGVLGLGVLFSTPLAEALRTNLRPPFSGVDVRAAQLGNRACIVGAAGLAIRVLEGATVDQFFA